MITISDSAGAYRTLRRLRSTPMFASLFKGSRFLDADLEDWQLETWAWLMKHRGGMRRIEQTQLALPNRAFFPPSDHADHARAEHIFGCVKDLMGMTDWPCRLEPQTRAPGSAKVGEFWVLETPRSANGTFMFWDGEGIVTYAEDLINDPARLVATFAHELSHYLIRDIAGPPGGNAALELVTELAVAYSGMAIFSANTAFSFQQHGDTFSQGWHSQRNGYFSPRSWAFALAVFLALKGLAPDHAQKWLTRDLADMTKAAGRYLAKRPALLDPLHAIS